MAKYDKKTKKIMKEVMHDFKEGTLKSGHGNTVTERKQAIAIGLSEERKKSSKVLKKKRIS